MTTGPGPYLAAVGALTSTTYTHTLPIPAHSPYMHTASTAMHTPIEPRVKLPKIDLTKFDGDFTKWTTFWDFFESSVHMNSTLSKVHKFIYLRPLLQSTAADAISGLSLSSVNYDEAVTILRKRFGKKKLITKHMDALWNLEAVRSVNNLKSLCHLFDTVDAHVRGLRALGVPSTSYGELLATSRTPTTHQSETW